MSVSVLDEAKFAQRFTPATLLPPEEKDGRLIGSRELLALFRRRFKLIAGCAALGVGLSVLALYQVPNSYRAQSMILLQPDDPNLLEDTEQPVQQPNKSILDTEADLMTSRMFIGLVVDELNLIAEPSFNTYLPPSTLNGDESKEGLLGGTLARLAGYLPDTIPLFGRASEQEEPAQLPNSKVQRDRAITVLLSMLTITRSGESSVMDVSVVDGDPHRAARLADAITGLFVEWTRDQKRDDMKQAAEYLRQQASGLAARIAKIEQQIADYGRVNQVSNDPRDDLLRLTMQQANEQLSMARGDLTQARARLAQVKRAQAGASSENDPLLTSDFQNVLRGEEAIALRDRAELARNRGVNHPLVQEADAKIASIRAQIGKEFERLVEGLEGGVRVAEARVAEVEQQIAAAEAELRTRSLAEIKLRELNRDLLTEQKLYDVAAARLGKLDPFAQVAEPGARVVSRAEVPTTAYFPKPRMIVGGSLVGALVLGFLLAITLESLDTRVRDGRRAASLIRAPLLASLPKLRGRLGKPQPDIIEHLARSPRSPAADAFRTLYQNCRRAGSRSGKQVILLASGMPGEGSAAVAAGLAATAAQMGMRTLLLDCDVNDRSRPASLPSLSNPVSVADILEAGSDLGLAVHPVHPVHAIATLSVLTIAHDQPGGASGLNGEGFELLLTMLRKEHDVVVISAPPVLVAEEAIWGAAQADAAVLVAAWDRTTEETLTQASENFRTVGLRFTGLALTRVRSLTRAGRVHRPVATRSLFKFGPSS